MNAAVGIDVLALPLPELRQELTLTETARQSHSGTSWLIYDPVRHRYFEIDETSFELLSRWRKGWTISQLVDDVLATSGHRIAAEDVAGLLRFLEVERLVDSPTGSDWRKLAQEASRMRKGPWAWLIHNYLYFKIPLVRPQAFLQRTQWFGNFFASRAMRWTIVLLGLMGLYLVSREWDTFEATFKGLFSIEGAFAFAVALVFIKTLHELGHAYTAVRYGCRVSSMGIAFMVMTPIMYTDVTDAWRLASRRSRLAIDSAGVIVELMIAAVATFLWPFLPPGTLKGIVFVVATTSWIMSLAINLNPFMRFDGYYILSDLVGIQNLQPRSFALARWRLREFLFDLDEPPPEIMSASRQRWLVGYAFATWIYRLLLFIGIALLVYHYFFKLLGIVLFAVEILFFVALPIWREVMEWRSRSSAIWASPRSYLSLAVLVAAIAAVLVPWSGRVDIPVVIEPVELARVFPPRAGQIVAIHVAPGQSVKEGDVLVEMKSDVLESQLALVATRIRATRVRLARIAADQEDREKVVVLERELKSLQAERRGLLKSKSELKITAPITGTAVSVSPEIHPGRLVAKPEQIMTIANVREVLARGYVRGRDVERVEKGMSGKIILDDGRLRSIPVRVAEVGDTGVAEIDIEDVSSVYGGIVDSQENSKRRIVPSEAQFPIRLAIDGDKLLARNRVAGLAVIDGVKESYGAKFWRQVVKIAVREGGI